ncbi:endonuclease 8-like 1 isoform X2 [Erythrolamprus reginae]|uniref:endonuclease 8-like 1 isoform X2 n=1 Tax=Erythrolamprus reginae TaxID=121349 RepID=UPI00396CBB05
MPEGPELFLASRYINAECAGITFTGKVEKSEVSKNPEVPFESDGYLISAASRGKELKLTLTPLKQEGLEKRPMDLVFRFGMSGNFKLVPISDMPKHAHLRFYTQEKAPRVLCYVDVRRFGKWEVDGTWQAERGPCVMLEYERFRDHVLRNLPDKAFDKPICEALLNQKFFNGVGNYLRAEILYRSKIAPFEKARTVLEDLQKGLQGDPGPLAPKEGKSRKKKIQSKPAMQTSKAPKPRRNSNSSPAHKEAKGRKKRRPENGVTQEKEEDAVVERARGPKTRSQKSYPDLEESLGLSSPAPARKRRTPAPKKQSEKAKASALSRPKRVKAS